MDNAGVNLAIDDGIATITFDQPNSRANVLSTALWMQLCVADAVFQVRLHVHRVPSRAAPRWRRLAIVAKPAAG